jgi:hypothetical protein
MTLRIILGRYQHFGGMHHPHLQDRNEQSWESVTLYHNKGKEMSCGQDLETKKYFMTSTHSTNKAAQAVTLQTCI